MKPGHLHDTEDCRAVSEILQRIGDKWSLLVVRRLGDGPMRRIQGKALLIVLDKALFPLGLEDAGNRDLMQPQPLAYGYVGHTKA